MNHSQAKIAAGSSKAAADMGTGFAAFADRFLRGRDNSMLLNSSVGLALLEAGVPHDESSLPIDLPAMMINNRNIYNPADWGTGVFIGNHPLFDFSADNLTLFGLDFPDLWAQLGGAASEHHKPLYDGELGTTLGEKLGLPDLPYGELAHLAHLGMSFYDAGRTFSEVWREVGDYYEKHNTNPMQHGLSLAAHLGKTITHPDMLHTLAARSVMLVVMGLLHPLGPLISICIGHLAMHLVHGFFGVMERNKDTIQRIENVPVLREIYNASGIKAWAERDLNCDAEWIDPLHNAEVPPEQQVHKAIKKGRLDELALKASAA